MLGLGRYSLRLGCFMGLEEKRLTVAVGRYFESLDEPLDDESIGNVVAGLSKNPSDIAAVSSYLEALSEELDDLKFALSCQKMQYGDESAQRDWEISTLRLPKTAEDIQMLSKVEVRQIETGSRIPQDINIMMYDPKINGTQVKDAIEQLSPTSSFVALYTAAILKDIAPEIRDAAEDSDLGKQRDREIQDFLGYNRKEGNSRSVASQLFADPPLENQTLNSIFSAADAHTGTQSLEVLQRESPKITQVVPTNTLAANDQYAYKVG